MYIFNKVFNITKYLYPNHWIKCYSCNSILFLKTLKLNLSVCYKCNYHFKINVKNRISFLFDFGNYVELFNHIYPFDYFKFLDNKFYFIRLIESQFKTSELESLLVFKGKLYTIDIIICIFEFNFIGGSMGGKVGDKFLNAIKICLKNKIPLICFSTSGGARIQEFLISLIQMSKITAKLSKLFESNIPYISIITNPCLGGVSASLSMLGDINISEPHALIGFSGPKVTNKYFKNKTFFGFQSSEFLLNCGFLDFVLNRSQIRNKLGYTLKVINNKCFL